MEIPWTWKFTEMYTNFAEKYVKFTLKISCLIHLLFFNKISIKITK